MQFSQVLFFFCALGAFNILWIALLMLFVYRNKSQASYFFASILTLIGIRVGISCIYFFEKDLSWTIVQIGMYANVLIGPFLLAFIRSSHNKKVSARKTTLHLFAIVTALIVPAILFPIEDNVLLWDHKIRYLLHTVLTLYLLVSLVYLLKFNFPKPYKTREEKITLLVFLFVLYVSLSFSISLFTNYVLGPFLTSVGFYLGVYVFIVKIYRIPNLFPGGKKSEAGEEIHEFLARLELTIYEEKLYKHPKLRLADVAKKMDISPGKLSKILKDGCNQSFNKFINQFRVEEAKNLLRNDHVFSIEGIGFESGFNSRSSFFSTFKEYTGLTPKLYESKYGISGLSKSIQT